MKSYLSTTILYLALGAFIVCWWMCAFQGAKQPLVLTDISSSQTLALNTSRLLDELSPLQRDVLQSALAGNFSKVLDFIECWDRDALFLSDKGISNVRRLSAEHYLQAHILAHLLQNCSSQTIRQLNCKMNLDIIQDDSGRMLPIHDFYDRFLPQTFVAASFLLAIAHPREIVALPKGMRYLPQLYPPEKLALVPDNIDRTRSEKLHLAHPHLAFVAPYSHPPALEVLRHQNIQLYTIKYVDNIAEIQDALLKVGHASNHILEAQLLAIFIEASLLAIDNRLQTLFETAKFSDNNIRMLYLYYHQHFMQPTTKCLTGQLITRALSRCPNVSCPIPKSTVDWRLPFDHEKIVQADPDCLLISTSFSLGAHFAVQDASILGQLKAAQSKHIFYLDESIQESPTQYIALAYYDIYQALAAATCL